MINKNDFLTEKDFAAIKKPIPITIEFDDGDGFWSMHNADLKINGFADTEERARDSIIEDLKDLIALCLSSVKKAEEFIEICRKTKDYIDFSKLNLKEYRLKRGYTIPLLNITIYIPMRRPKLRP